MPHSQLDSHFSLIFNFASFFLSIFALFVLFVLSLVTRQSNYLTSPNRRAPLLLMPSPLLSGQFKRPFPSEKYSQEFCSLTYIPLLILLQRKSWKLPATATAAAVSAAARSIKKKRERKSDTEKRILRRRQLLLLLQFVAFPFQFKMQSSCHRLCRQSIQ